ncbi:Oxidoreductase sirO [Lachnellula arida]|uniref:Oxidoreductase sirO n=1 Tax=Lachnellula arida TaxID=1316785 RepID=A0A8T9BB32_9HELO|nr:Oxidoreductase sirO [Lachnellula arida]
MSSPSIIMGTGGFGVTWSKDDLGALARALKEAGIDPIDTAALYPVGASGLSEKLVGEGKFGEHGFQIDSKILFSGDGSGNLTAPKIQESLSKTFDSLKVASVSLLQNHFNIDIETYQKFGGQLNVLYCHGPDKTTPIAEQAAAFDAEYRNGKFQRLGVCNLSPEMLKEWLFVATEKGYVKPSVFQGQYNLLSRTYESTLFPLLREHGISFVAFSPLAGGFLTGKLTFSSGAEDLKATRFEVSDTNFMGMGYRHWYDKPSMHAAVQKMEGLCKENGVSLTAAAWRWILYHSPLEAGHGDAVIVGPRNLEQLQSYDEIAKQGPLTDDLAQALNDLWEGVAQDAAGIVVY